MGLTEPTPGFWLHMDYNKCPTHWKAFLRTIPSNLDVTDMLSKYGMSKHTHWLNSVDRDTFIAFESEACYVRYLLEFNGG